MVRLVSSVRFRQGAHPGRRSSVGQSTRLIIVGSPVRVRPPLPVPPRVRQLRRRLKTGEFGPVGGAEETRSHSGEEREAGAGDPGL